MNVEIDPTIMWEVGQKTLPNLAENLSAEYEKLEISGDDFREKLAWGTSMEEARNLSNAFNDYRYFIMGIISTSTWNIYAVAEAVCEMAAEFAESDGEASAQIQELIASDDSYDGVSIGDGPRDVDLPAEPDADEVPSFS